MSGCLFCFVQRHHSTRPEVMWDSGLTLGSSVDPSLPNKTAPDTLGLWPDLGCEKVGMRTCELRTSQRAAKAEEDQPPGQAEASGPSDHASCVCGPNCFLIALLSRQDKIVSLEKHVRGVGVSLEEARLRGNPEPGVMFQNSLTSPRSGETSW